MELNEALSELQKLGTAQNRKVWARHGAGDSHFGVSMGNITLLKRQIKKNHALALQLWETKIVDAQILATLIHDSKEVTRELLQKWVNDFSFYVIADVFVKNVVLKKSAAFDLAQEWMQSDEEYVKCSGFMTLARLTKKESVFDERFLEETFRVIDRDLQSSPNRAKEAMNTALIAIGKRNSKLHKQAVLVARAIGKVVIDHGETECKTSDPIKTLLDPKLMDKFIRH